MNPRTMLIHNFLLNGGIPLKLQPLYLLFLKNLLSSDTNCCVIPSAFELIFLLKISS